MKEIIDQAVISSKALYQETKAFGASFAANITNPPLSEVKTLAKLQKKLKLEKVSPIQDRPLRILLLASINNWEIDLIIPLKELGELAHCNWKSVGYFPSKIEWLAYRQKVNKDMIDTFDKFARAGPVDVVVGYCSDFNTAPETLQYMKSKGAVILNFCWDDKLYFLSSHKQQYSGVGRIAPFVDLNLTNAPSSIAKYQRVGALAMFWPEGANPLPNPPHFGPIRTDIDALFVGGRYGWRGKFVERLIADGVKVLAYGNGWPNGPAPGDSLHQLYIESPIVLGFSGVGYSKKLKCLKGRDFEVPMAGGLYLTQYNPELKLVYDIEQEILTYKNYEDCKAKIHWVSQNREKALEIRKNGFQRALDDHSWKKRFEDVFTLCHLMPQK